MARRIWKVVKRATVAVAGLLLVLALLGFGYRAYSLRQIAQVVETPDGINEASFVKIGGIDQWITIRGQHRDNPPLLLVHGGPGNAFQSTTLRTFLDWEKEFTLVQ